MLIRGVVQEQHGCDAATSELDAARRRHRFKFTRVIQFDND